MSTVSCCSKNCLQCFPCDKIDALRSEMHVEGSVYHRKHRQLDVHKQIHRDADGRNMIILEGMEVCPKAWTTIIGVHRSSFYQYKADVLIGNRTEHHGNLGTKKPRMHTLQAIATLRLCWRALLIICHTSHGPRKMGRRL